jgi:hypothetical protein
MSAIGKGNTWNDRYINGLINQMDEDDNLIIDKREYFHWLIIVNNKGGHKAREVVAGYVGLHPGPDPSTLQVRIFIDIQGYGHGKSGLSLAIHEYYKKLHGTKNIVAVVDPQNIPSVGLFEGLSDWVQQKDEFLFGKKHKIFLYAGPDLPRKNNQGIENAYYKKGNRDDNRGENRMNNRWEHRDSNRGYNRGYYRDDSRGYYNRNSRNNYNKFESLNTGQYNNRRVENYAHNKNIDRQNKSPTENAYRDNYSQYHSTVFDSVKNNYDQNIFNNTHEFELNQINTNQTEARLKEGLEEEVEKQTLELVFVTYPSDNDINGITVWFTIQINDVENIDHAKIYNFIFNKFISDFDGISFDDNLYVTLLDNINAFGYYDIGCYNDICIKVCASTETGTF